MRYIEFMSGMVKQDTHGSRRLTSVSGIKHAAANNQPSRRTLLDNETTIGNCGVKQNTADRLATVVKPLASALRRATPSTVLLCEKPKSDPVDKNRKSNIVRSSHVPTCEKPAAQRLGASRKAAGKINHQTQPLFDSG